MTKCWVMLAGALIWNLKTYIETPKTSSQVISEPKEQAASMYIPTDLMQEHHSSDDVDHDPFDLLEVHLIGEDCE